MEPSEGQNTSSVRNILATQRESLDPPQVTPLIRPIERVAVSEQILSRLRHFLDRGQLKIGAKLPSERQLSSMLKVSRNSIREALKALTILGVLKSKHGKGTYLVSSLPKALNQPTQISNLQESSDIIDLWELRMVVEPYVASLAALRGTGKNWHSIEETLEAMRQSLTSLEKFQGHDLQFHLQITNACGNEFISEISSFLLQVFWGKVRKSRILDYAEDVPRKHGELAAFLADHAKVLDALRHRNPTLARSRMVQHLRKVGEYDSRLVRAMAARRNPEYKKPSRNGAERESFAEHTIAAGS